jgi:hypothetical protein
VSLLSVVPDLHGKKIGKKLLLDAVDRVARMGYYRIDLHTWPANMKAVPLYKKTGFFWVPDSMVYMQNYMPFLLGRPEFREFIGDSWWYEQFERDLAVEHDEEKTDSGREVFTYLFRREDRTFRAVFDRTGRILSSLETPDFSASIERSEGRVFFGVPMRVSLAGDSIPAGTGITADDSLRVSGSFDPGSDGVCVTPDPIRIPGTQRDRAPRVSVSLPSSEPLELGLGFRAEEPVSMVSPPIRFPVSGQEALELDLKRLADAEEVVLRYSIDDGDELKETVPLSGSVFQSHPLPLPELDEGIHVIRLVPVWNGVEGYPETVLLEIGPHCGEPEVLDTRRAMLILGKEGVVQVLRKGAASIIWGRSMDDRPERLCFLHIAAGPPIWHSDLPLQVYDLEEKKRAVHGSTDWPSRPGLGHSMWYRLHPAGYIEAGSVVDNDSAADQKVAFRAIWRAMEAFDPRTDVIPLKGSLHVTERVYNQLPDWSEDMPSKTADLGAPWTGLVGPDRAVMAYFPEWPSLQYDCPETGDIIVAAGVSAASPSFRILLQDGGLEVLLRKALSLGWVEGDSGSLAGFPDHNVEPFMLSGSTVCLTHCLNGERNAVISLGDTVVAEGSVKSGSAISGPVSGEGPVDVSLEVAGRAWELPAYLVGEESGVITEELDNGILLISNGRLKALIDPTERGHVYSLELDGVEFLRSSHPGPGELAWEKPWYGGLIPQLSDSHENPFRLELHRPDASVLERVTGGLCECGWEQVWNTDHKKYGSWKLSWELTLLPGVPVLRSRLDAEPLAGAASQGEIDVRGFLSPGGDYGSAVLSCQSDPGLTQGRNHAGAWGQMGRWARVETPGKGFVEAYSRGDGVLFCEDYSAEGCHLAVFCPLGRRKTVDILWLFGTAEEDKLSDILRFHV